MPRIAAALAVVAAVAFCIGFNAVRYPVVWEMLGRPGLLLPTAKPADTAAPAKPADTPVPAKAAAKPPPPEANSAQPAAPAPKPAANAAKRKAKAPKTSDPQPEFCTADGVCHIAGGPQATTRPGPSAFEEHSNQGRDSLPELPRDASLSGLGSGREKDSVEALPAAKHGGLATTSPPERPKSAPAGQATAMPAELARVERPLAPVPDGPAVSPSASGRGAAAGGVGVADSLTPSGGAAPRAGDGRLRPLPPVDDPATAAAGPMESQTSNALSRLYPTTGHPAVDWRGQGSGDRVQGSGFRIQRE